MTSPQWDSAFYKNSKLFSPLIPVFSQLKVDAYAWPSLENYNQLNSTNPIINANEKPIKFVSQLNTSNTFAEQYEPMIFLNGEVQTRLESWHDFFQVLVWKTFPHLKSTINALHYSSANSRYKNDSSNKSRSALENFLTLFDECGAIIVYSDEIIPTLLNEFNWKELFITHRQDFSEKVECIVFGHAMYEKAIQPYIGMTSHCLLVKQPESFFELSTEYKNKILDEILSKKLSSEKNWTTKSLQPLPILGVPEWHEENSNPNFYNNENYFRKKSNRQRTRL